MFRKTSGDVIVGFFPGTGYNYKNDSTDEIDDESLHIDQSFLDLTQSLSTKSTEADLKILGTENDDAQLEQYIYGYDGCHERGGGIFAYGIEEPSLHIFDKVKAKVNENPDGENVTLVLIAHSRGYLSALLVAKKINADTNLKNKVDVVLDLRDPVPGNFYATAAIDVVGITMAKKLFNLEDCFCIKEAHITIQEKGILNIAFDVLIPKFHTNTKLSVEYLPGYHDIQERIDTYDVDHQNIVITDPLIYLLGFLKSLLILIENGAPINYQSVRDKLSKYLDMLSNNEKNILSSKIYLILNSLYPNSKTPSELNYFFENLKKVQLVIYELLLNQFSPPEKLSKENRVLHFGGTFSVTAPNPEEANCFNMRHAALVHEIDCPGKEDQTYYPKPLLGFHQASSQRTDINNAKLISIPNNLFQQRYQRIMLVLDQQIESNLLIPNVNSPRKYIDIIKLDLKNIAKNNTLSQTQKILKMDSYLLAAYQSVRANEGWFTSRLRTGLERIMNSNDLLTIKNRYGIHFPEKNNQNYAELYERSEKLSQIISTYKNTAENHTDLYNYGIKFLIKLIENQEKFTPKNEIEKLDIMVIALLKDGNKSQSTNGKNERVNNCLFLESDDERESDKNKNIKDLLFEKFKFNLLNTYKNLRKNESKNERKNNFSCFHKSSRLGDFIEKFTKNELRMNIPRTHDLNNQSDLDTVESQYFKNPGDNDIDNNSLLHAHK